MPQKTKVMLANCLMTLGIIPYLVVLSYLAWTSNYRGDAALASIFMAILGFGVAYLVALTIAYPAFLWSHFLAKSSGHDSRFSLLLRWAVMAGIFPVFAIFPVLAFSLVR